ncbi:1-deoxy-D-xylulose-5-phosphate reductoisomerase [Culicoidibacter larvae]|uniref:1-deoxy-D-xylulose 5-phosphate reductoisomerase n=1 Tax=Culicoidibacter larvae TaxID=2579976 RepID=A0A5R8QGV4_9FIRM|nr:1-deoxy-D-xylulose-5-phosphate reductoisomerase [Culicoidibacter larvae]TLG76507.1 1-deoxy-D-xylulose-5-phosphate reductoisomerase [Culicoidibacter larvae]
MKHIAILGASGSIGTQALDIIASNPNVFRLVSCSIGKNIDYARKIVQVFEPELLCMQYEADAQTLEHEFRNKKTEFTFGDQGLVDVVSLSSVDLVLNSVIGSVGLLPTLAAINEGKQIALANKETLVSAGHIVMEAARKNNVEILPVDSEHAAIFQCLQSAKSSAELKRLHITASGGSFRDLSYSELKDVTVDMALKHPNWSMGSKITIDSATMMNKGLEVIEAHWLFDVGYSQIETIIHRESIIHSLVEFVDGSMLAQLGVSDMHIPIQYMLSYPERLPMPATMDLSLIELGALHFEAVDIKKYPCFKLALDAGKIGGSMPTVLNAANEIAVNAFLENKIKFIEISKIVEQTMLAHDVISNPQLDDILEIDHQARTFVEHILL